MSRFINYSTNIIVISFFFVVSRRDSRCSPRQECKLIGGNLRLGPAYIKFWQYLRYINPVGRHPALRVWYYLTYSG